MKLRRSTLGHKDVTWMSARFIKQCRLRLMWPQPQVRFPAKSISSVTSCNFSFNVQKRHKTADKVQHEMESFDAVVSRVKERPVVM